MTPDQFQTGGSDRMKNRAQNRLWSADEDLMIAPRLFHWVESAGDPTACALALAPGYRVPVEEPVCRPRVAVGLKVRW